MRRAIFLYFALVAGCVAPGGAGSHAGEDYVVNTQRSLFYKIGPAQAGGADMALYHGQAVKMLSYQFGFSQIAMPDGQTGYVATEDLIKAPPEAKPSPTPGVKNKAAPGVGARHRTGSGHAGRAPTRSEEGEVPPPELPTPQAPPPTFRY